MASASSGFEVSYEDIQALQKAWTTQQGLISPMAGQLSDMLGQITDAANAAMKGKSASEQGAIKQLAEDAQSAVSEAMSAVSSLSGQLSQDAGNLSQTADTYHLAELVAKDHITSLATLASYSGPDASQIHSALQGETTPQQGQTEQDAMNLAFPGSAGSGAPGSGSGEGPGSETSGSSYGGPGAASGGAGTGAGSSGAGYAGGSGGAGGGYAGGVGTPVPAGVAASSAQVKKWIQEAIKILEKDGIPASKLDPNAIALIIQHESGGNPDAVNNWDINAKEGNSSEGLMQTTPTTFQAYASAGHTNILNPIDNIMAASKYAIARYGSLDNVPGVVAVEHGGAYVGY